MNRALLNPFESANLPKTIQDYLEHDKATCMRFNRHGNLLAVGTATGRVVLWDFDTYTVATTLPPPSGLSTPVAVVSLAFPAPANAASVLVAYNKGLLLLFHTLSATVQTDFRCPFNIHAVHAHPKDHSLAIIVPVDSLPLLIALRRGRYTLAIPVSSSPPPTSAAFTAGASDPHEFPPFPEPPSPPHTTYGNTSLPTFAPPASHISLAVLHVQGDPHPHALAAITTKSAPGGRRKSQSFAIVFTRSGRHVLRAGPNGIIHVFKVAPEDVLIKERNGDAQEIIPPLCVAGRSIPCRAPIRSIHLAPRAARVLVNSGDKCMRLFELEQLVPDENTAKAVENCNGSGDVPVLAMDARATFTEVVNRTQCRCACFSRDGEFVLGGVDGTDHRIHIWRVVDGHLEVTLEGPKEGIVELLWHPLRPVIASLGQAGGGVYVWAKNFSENWSAFATQFAELEANEEYVEAEDEFDIVEGDDNDRLDEERDRNESADVDVVTNYGGYFSSDESDNETFFYIPAVPAPDDEDGGVGTVRSLADEIMGERMGARERTFVMEVQAGGDGGSSGESRRKRGRTVERGLRTKKPRGRTVEVVTGADVESEGVMDESSDEVLEEGGEC